MQHCQAGSELSDTEEELSRGEKLRQAIEAKNLDEAKDVLSNLGNQILDTEDLLDCLKALVSKFSNLDDPVTQNLLLELLSYPNDDGRYDLVDYIIGNLSRQNSDRKKAYLRIVTKVFKEFPSLAAHTRTGRGQNLFHAAADKGVFDVIKIAKNSMTDVVLLSRALLLKNFGQNTPLAIAVKSQNVSTVKALVENTEITTTEMITQAILISTLSEGKEEEEKNNTKADENHSILQTLIGSRVNLITRQLLEKAIPKGSIRTWKYLLDKVQPKLVENSDLLKLAVENQRVEIVESLVEKNSDLVLWKDENNDNKTVLYFNKALTNLDKRREIRDIIALKIIEKCEPKDIRELLKDSSGFRREIGLDLSVLRTSPEELQRFLALIKTELGLIQDELALIKAEVATVTPNTDDGRNMERFRQIHIDFEPCLRDVVIPLFDSNASTCPRFAPMEPRCEVKEILEWLYMRKVRRILALHVLDSFHSPHTEETIENAVKPFRVDILDWRRMDLSIDCILVAAENVETLSLYSSGNWAVLSHWSGNEGIGRLKKLVTVTINIARDLIGQTRADVYQVKTEKRLEKLKAALEAQWTYRVQTWRWGTSPHQHNNDAYESMKMAPASVLHIEPFLESYENFVRAPGAGFTREKLNLCRTKAAIIDSGVQRANLTCKYVTGASFVYNDKRESPWWLSQEPHGTQMANIIHELDPNCELYIAKVGETKTDIRADRVVEAIEWAISKGVDVISMSLVLFNKPEKPDKSKDESDPLTLAVDKATGTNSIIMLCSTADDGNNYQEVYPASHPSVLAIAACNSFGKRTQWSTETTAKYVFQGEDILTTANTRIQASGSSVATAMGAGVVSLILACLRIREQVKGVNGERRRRSIVVEQILRNKMMEIGDKSRYVQPKLFFKTLNERPISKPRLFIDCLEDILKD